MLSVLANCEIELTDLEILRVEDWYSTIGALQLASYVYLLHAFTVCGAEDIHMLSVPRQSLKNDLYLLVKLEKFKGDMLWISF